MSSGSGPSKIPIDVVARCTREAQKDGVFAGLSAGLAGAIIGSRLFRFNRNTTMVCGVVTGVLAGYQFTQGFLSAKLARWEAEQAMLNPSHQEEFDRPT